MNEGIDKSNATGALTLTFGGKSYVLAAPDTGRMREFAALNEKRFEAEMQMLSDLIGEQIDTPTEPEGDEAETVDRLRARLLAQVERLREDAQHQETLLAARRQFWRDACLIWGVQLPHEDDRLPFWLGNAELIDVAVDHWMHFPFRHLGDPAAGS